MQAFWLPLVQSDSVLVVFFLALSCMRLLLVMLMAAPLVLARVRPASDTVHLYEPERANCPSLLVPLS